jgi:probable HAF family extracellular repeat protein
MKTSAVTTAALAVVLATGSGAGGAVSTEYRLVDLGTLGGQSSYAMAINDRGDVVGSSQTADGSYHGFLWRNGRMTDLGTVRPTDINNKGQIVGTVDTDQGLQAVLWSRGKITDLGTLGSEFDWPTAINGRGQIVGIGTTANGTTAPFLWSQGRMRKLNLDDVSDINNRGQITGGRLISSGGFHASVWWHGKVTDLGAGPFDRSNTHGINERGWVIGWMFSEQQDERGVLWRHGTVTDVGTLGGGRTHLISVNNQGQILGTSQLASGHERPVLWQRGVLTDLTTWGVDAEADLVGINNRGDIAVSIRPVWGTAHAAVYL